MLGSEIGYFLLNLGRQFGALPAAVFQSILSVFVTLFNAVGCSQRPVVEHFVKQVYIRGLGCSLDLLSEMVGKDYPLQEILALGVGQDKAVDSPSPIPEPRLFRHADCRVESLELVLESLCDLAADDMFLPALFASFDCNARQLDLLQPLLQLLARSTSLVVTAGLEKLGPAKELGVLIVQCYKQILNTLTHRKHREELWKEGHKKVVPSNAEQLTGTCIDVDTAATIFVASRRCKTLLSEASAKFSNKPSDAFSFMQQQGMLPKPLSPTIAAHFLRYSPLLSKAAVGSFLGELGKQDAKNEWDEPRFHTEMLLKYVESFELTGKSMLDCMRIFLSAFRLPGESQQIDRILVAFSEYCHKSCREGKDGLLGSPDMVYLLSFSIIMLNTDRHNPNIKAEKKMTLEQFLRNNTNYGAEYQSQDLSKDFLTAIYNSISEHQIRTEGDDPWAFVTDEEWMDLQMQCRASYLLGSSLFFVQTDDQPRVVSEEGTEALLDTTGFVVMAGRELQDHVAAQLFETKWGLAVLLDAVVSSASLKDVVWLWDRDIVRCCADLLLLPCIAVHVYNHRLVTTVLSTDAFHQTEPAEPLQVNGWKERTGRLISLSEEFTTELLSLATKHRLGFFVEQTVLLLQEVSGVHQSALCEHFVTSLCTDNYLTRVLSVESFRKEGRLAVEWRVLPGQFSELIAFPSTQKALLFTLEVISSYSSFITSWEVVLFCLAVLRDHILLPSDMVLDVDGDILPPNIRHDFDTKLSKLDPDASSKPPTESRKESNSRGSFLSLQVLGEALFGASSSAEYSVSAHGLGRPEVRDEDKEMLALLVERYSKPSSRWDAGYDHLPLSIQSALVQHADGTNSSENNKRLVWDESLRASVAKTSICSLVTESKFLPESVLTALMRCIAQSTEYYTLPEGSADMQLIVDYENLPPMEVLSAEDLCLRGDLLPGTAGYGLLLRELAPKEKICRSMSASSIAWLEMVLVELALRNRDRFQVCWPTLRAHYLRSLGSNSFKLSYVAERQMSGVLKLVARMLSRDHYAGTMIELLGKIFAPLLRNSSDSGRKSESMSTLDIEDSTFATPNMTPARDGLSALANQITAGMWRILTQNVDLLPLLSLEQWETVFRIIAFGSNSGSYAAFKSFEVMAWLLHEPRLIANVPVFCIIAVKPLVRNKNAPIFVSTGAVKLLKYLHSRLEALIQDAPEVVEEEEGYDHIGADDDSTVIWKVSARFDAVANFGFLTRQLQKCWLPILQALAEGVSDDRQEVREACATALCESISDRHSTAVPNGILIDVLVHVLIPVIRVLGDLLVADWHRKALLTPTAPHVTARSTASMSAPKGMPPSVLERDEKDWVNVDGAGEEKQNVVLHCIQTLSQVFLGHIKKLSAYPSFDKLWLQVLHILSYFVGTQHSTDHSLASVRDNLSAHLRSDQMQVLGTIATAAFEQLELLLKTLQKEEIFRRRQGLLSVTRDYLQQVRDCDKLLHLLE